MIREVRCVRVVQWTLTICSNVTAIGLIAQEALGWLQWLANVASPRPCRQCQLCCLSGIGGFAEVSGVQARNSHIPVTLTIERERLFVSGHWQKYHPGCRSGSGMIRRSPYWRQGRWMTTLEMRLCGGRYRGSMSPKCASVIVSAAMLAVSALMMRGPMPASASPADLAASTSSAL